MTNPTTPPAVKSGISTRSQRKPGKHSEKPDEVRAIVDNSARKFKLNPKIELFARDRIETWDSWGDVVQTDKVVGGCVIVKR